jgi:cholesterol oxidase
MTTSSLLALGRAWRSLPEPALDEMAGTFDGEFVGPGPVPLLLSAGLALCGMPGWHGKRFDTPERGINRLAPGTGFPMFARLDASYADGRTAIVATYGERERAPFRWLRDEFRAYDERTLLGLSFVDAPGLRRAGVPFLLHRAR